MNEYSYQLYSSRNFTPLENTLQMLASLGYRYVEGYGGLAESIGSDVGQLKTLLDQSNLAMPCCHIGIEQLEDDKATVVDLSATLGIQKIFVPAIDEDKRTQNASDWMELAGRLQQLHQSYAAEGLAIGWHNHDFEFSKTETGEYALDILLTNAPDIELEFDLAWAVRAGQDPMVWIEKYKPRIVAAHLKDLASTGECSDEDGWADVGHGIMDWKALHMELVKSDLKFLIMEHDNPSDHKRFASRSIDYCHSLKNYR